MERPDFFKTLIWDNLIVKAALTELFAAFPFLAWGPMGLITAHVVSKFADIAYDRTKTYIRVELIVFHNEKVKTQFVKSSVELQKFKDPNSEAFKNARKKYQDDLASLVFVGPS